MKKIILSGGGTGGHIYPAVTIAKALQEKEPVEILFVGTPNGMESMIIPREGYSFVSMPMSGLKRKFTFQNISILFKTFGSLWKARTILKNFKPDVVIGTGGYVCGPILLMAALAHIPTIIQEQNVIPGFTNKILSYFVDRIALGYKEAQNYFPIKNKCVYTGNPIRSDIIKISKKEARIKLGIPENFFMILVAGGSRGAHNINKAMIGVHKYFANKTDIYIYHITGTKEFTYVQDTLQKNMPDKKEINNSQIVDYQQDMPTAIAAADVIIYRAGAIGLAEIAAKNLPAILIPYPYAAEDHQTFNAQVFVEAGAATMVLDKELTAESLISNIEELYNDMGKRKRMSDSANKLKMVDAGAQIASMALKMADEKRR